MLFVTYLEQFQTDLRCQLPVIMSTKRGCRGVNLNRQLMFTSYWKVTVLDSGALSQGCRNPRSQGDWANTICKVAPNVWWTSLENLLQVSLLGPRILWQLLVFWGENLCTSAVSHS
jgi:hypothetical protein